MQEGVLTVAVIDRDERAAFSVGKNAAAMSLPGRRRRDRRVAEPADSPEAPALRRGPQVRKSAVTKSSLTVLPSWDSGMIRSAVVLNSCSLPT